jgi:hypothetical protein
VLSRGSWQSPTITKEIMFQLTQEETDNLKSQFVTSSWGWVRRATPYAFTELGVAMLSSVLRSERAVRVNIEIMRAFVRLRRLLGQAGVPVKPSQPDPTRFSPLPEARQTAHFQEVLLPDLARLVAAWPTLPETAKVAIRAASLTIANGK